MTISCPVCHTENDKDARYCRKCGKTLSHSLLEECVAIVQRYPDYSQSLDSAILQLTPDIQWGVTSLKNNAKAYKVGKVWHLNFCEHSGITFIHDSLYKTVSCIYLSKDCNLKNIHPTLECLDFRLSISDWEKLLATANILYDIVGFPKKDDLCSGGFGFPGHSIKEIFDNFGDIFGGTFSSQLERSAYISYYTANFSFNLKFKAYTKEQQNTLESVTITYRHLEKESFWRRL